MGQIANIICNGASIETIHGSDEWIASEIHVSNVGRKATKRLADYFLKVNPDSPHTSFRDRAVSMGVWKTWTTKAGKVKPVGVVDRKSELRKLYPDSFEDNAEWIVICAYESLRVTLASAKALDKHDADKEAKESAGETATASEAATANETATASEAANLVQVETSPVKDALGIINKVLAQMEMDESMTDLAGELRKAAAMLAA